MQSNRPRRVSLAPKTVEQDRQEEKIVLTNAVSAVVREPDDAGLIFQYLCPVDGRLSDLKIHILEMKAKKAIFSLVKREGRMTFESQIDVVPGVNEYQETWDVHANDRIEIRVLSMDFTPNENITNPIQDIWIAFMYRTD